MASIMAGPLTNTPAKKSIAYVTVLILAMLLYSLLFLVPKLDPASKELMVPFTIAMMVFRALYSLWVLYLVTCMRDGKCTVGAKVVTLLVLLDLVVDALVTMTMPLAM